MVEALQESNAVADAAIERTRSGSFPNEADAAALDRRPLIDLLRRAIKSDVVVLLLNELRSGSGAAFGLAVNLLRHPMREPRVRAALESEWLTASLYMKNRIMWRLLDCEDLAPPWHDQFRHFASSELDVQAFNKIFYGSPHNALKSLVSRLADPIFPISEKWIYLCCAPGAPEDDPRAVDAVVHLGLLIPDTVAQVIAKLLVERLGARARGSEGLAPIPKGTVA